MLFVSLLLLVSSEWIEAFITLSNRGLYSTTLGRGEAEAEALEVREAMDSGRSGRPTICRNFAETELSKMLLSSQIDTSRWILRVVLRSLSL